MKSLLILHVVLFLKNNIFRNVHFIASYKIISTLSYNYWLIVSLLNYMWHRLISRSHRQNRSFLLLFWRDASHYCIISLFIFYGIISISLSSPFIFQVSMDYGSVYPHVFEIVQKTKRTKRGSFYNCTEKIPDIIFTWFFLEYHRYILII